MKTNLNNLILALGIFLVAAAALILGRIFFPVIKEEVKYSFSPQAKNLTVASREEAERKKDEKSDTGIIVPADEQFGIVIPKISANAKVIPEVDSQNPDIYQRALTKGVAHAKGSALPDEDGNIFIFAHSGADLLEANRYNAVFYLLSKLEVGDEVYLFYKGKKYRFQVEEKKNAGVGEVSYLEKNTPENQLTLMTCWPPGTTLKRLIVIAKPI